jgi:ribosome maturation factor RimP
MGPAGPFFMKAGIFERKSLEMASVHDKERQLQREIAERVEGAVRGVDVLAVELSGPDRMTVFIDHPQGVDLQLCERVTHVLDAYRRQYGVDVSSPGIERPLRKPAHFRNAVGRQVSLRTDAAIEGRKKFKGEVKDANETGVTVGVDGADHTIPYESIVRGNLIDEG